MQVGCTPTDKRETDKIKVWDLISFEVPAKLFVFDPYPIALIRQEDPLAIQVNLHKRLGYRIRPANRMFFSHMGNE